MQIPDIRPFHEYPIVAPVEMVPSAPEREEETRLIQGIWLQKRMEELEEKHGDWGLKDWYP